MVSAELFKLFLVYVVLVCKLVEIIIDSPKNLVKVFVCQSTAIS